MKLAYQVVEDPPGHGFFATVLRDGAVWGLRGPYRTQAEARRAIELMSGDTGERIGDSPNGAKTLLRSG